MQLSILNYDDKSCLFLMHRKKKSNVNICKDCPIPVVETSHTFEYEYYMYPTGMSVESIDGAELFYWDDILFSTLSDKEIYFYLLETPLYQKGEYIRINYDQFSKLKEYIPVWHARYIEVMSKSYRSKKIGYIFN